MTYFCRISPKLTSGAAECGRKNTRFVFLRPQLSSGFSHHPAFDLPSKLSFSSLYGKQSAERIGSRARQKGRKHGWQRVHPPKPPCCQPLPARAAAHNVPLFAAPRNKGCCWRLMPAQGWHAPTWARQPGEGAQGRGEGEQRPRMYKEVSERCAAPGCWTSLDSSRCSGEVWLPAGTCGVSIPGFGTGG